MNAQIKLYKDCIDVINAMACCVKVSDAINRFRDSRGKRSSTMTSKGTIWEKTMTLRYNKVPTSKIGNLKNWSGTFNNGLYTLTRTDKTGEAYAVSIPISELDRLYREEEIQSHLEKQSKKMTSPYSPVGMNEVNPGVGYYQNVDQSLTRPKQDLYQSTKNLAVLITSIAGVIGALYGLKDSVFAVPIKKLIEKLSGTKRNLEGVQQQLNQAQQQIGSIR
jgi:hypothetical protein